MNKQEKLLDGLRVQIQFIILLGVMNVIMPFWEDIAFFSEKNVFGGGILLLSANALMYLNKYKKSIEPPPCLDPTAPK